MPTRVIRDGILTSERVNALTPMAELFYRRLLSVVDDYGRFLSNAQLLRASCYPLKLDSVKEDSITKHLAECVDAGLIVLYTVAGKGYLEVQDFGQRINGKAKYPAPSERVPGESRGIPGNPRLDVDVGVVVDEVKPLAPAAPVVREGFARFWAAYPKRRREKKAEAEKVWKQQGLEAFVDLILAHVTAQSKTHDWQKDGGQFAPQPPAYLRGKRWLDAEPVAEQPTVPVPERRKETPEEALAAMQAHFGDSLLGARP